MWNGMCTNIFKTNPKVSVSINFGWPLRIENLVKVWGPRKNEDSLNPPFFVFPPLNLVRKEQCISQAGYSLYMLPCMLSFLTEGFDYCQCHCYFIIQFLFQLDADVFKFSWSRIHTSAPNVQPQRRGLQGMMWRQERQLGVDCLP